MAKKSSRGEFNMAQEIRNLLLENKTLSGPEVVAALKAKFPGQTINKNSASVAFAGAKKKLGIKSGRRKVRRRRPAAAAAPRSAAPRATATTAVSLEQLSAARDLLQKCRGDVAVAASALKGVAALQMG